MSASAEISTSPSRAPYEHSAVCRDANDVRRVSFFFLHYRTACRDTHWSRPPSYLQLQHTHTHTHIVCRSAGVNSEDIFTVRVSNSRQRHSYKLYMPYSKSTVRYNYKPARHRDAEGLIFYRGGFFFFLSSFFFRRLISEFTKRISTKLGHIFTCDCCLKNLVQTPPRIHPHGRGAKPAFWDRL